MPAATMPPAVPGDNPPAANPDSIVGVGAKPCPSGERHLNGRLVGGSSGHHYPCAHVNHSFPGERPMTILKTFAAASFAALMTVSTAFAAGGTPTGTWQTTTGESRFQVTLCGDGTQLCAKLVWLRDDARTAENLPYLDTYVLMGAKRVVGNKWRGEADYLGETVKGTLALVDEDTMTLNGCKGLVCQKFTLTRL
jgi:uncharacterized protein (DUF2147 family)